jgi:hypothetical protein
MFQPPITAVDRSSGPIPLIHIGKRTRAVETIALYKAFFALWGNISASRARAYGGNAKAATEAYVDRMTRVADAEKAIWDVLSPDQLLDWQTLVEPGALRGAGQQQHQRQQQQP